MAFAALVTLLGAAQSARAQKSPTAQAALLRAQHDLMTNDFVDAAAEMETAVRFEPRFAFGWYLLGSTSRRAGSCDRAVAAYRRYLELRPAEPDPLFGIGLCLQVIGDRDGALTSFQRYVERDTRPGSAEFVTAAKARIAALEKAKAADAAAKPASKAGAGAGGAGPVASGAGGVGGVTSGHAAAGTELVAEHKSAAAVAELQAAVKEAPADAASWYKLAFALRQSGQLPEAAKAYQRYITLKPDDPDPYYGLAQVLVALNRPDDALATFRAYVKIEHRKTEQRWLTKARAEIVRLEAARKPPAPTQPKALSPPPAAGGPPAISTTPASVSPHRPTSPPPPASPPPAQ
jgi:cytochrome c-type biogenesis protein CcmH/NrfG